MLIECKNEVAKVIFIFFLFLFYIYFVDLIDHEGEMQIYTEILAAEKT